MGVCTGCAILFRGLDSTTCMKCVKLAVAPSSIEREVIADQPQCENCSVVYPYMKNVLCGGCMEASTLSTKANTVKDVISRAAQYQSTASQHRLNQPPTLNAGLQAANAAQVKNKMTMIKKQAKADTVTAEATLYYFPKNGAVAKKAQLLPVLKKYFGSDPAKRVLDTARDELKKAWLESPASNVGGINTMNFDDAIFGINQSAKAVYQFERTEDCVVGSVEAMFNALKAESKLSESDIKDRRLSLRVYVYETQSVSDDTDDYESSNKLSLRQSSVRATSSYRKPSTKRKASNSISTTTEYTSSYRPRKLLSTAREKSEIEYKSHEFQKTTISIDSEGNLEEIVSLEETIKISENWRKYCNGDKAKDGYLSKGATKFAFLGQFDGVPYAIFQCKQGSGVTEASNHADLLAELKLLVHGQYFAESFAQRAETYKVRIPSIRWNSRGAFLGKATNSWLDDISSLPFKTFLAAPLLDTSGVYTERKFSGSTMAGRSIDVVGSAMDAYAHHTLVDSNGAILLTDLQGVVGPSQSVILFDPQAHSEAADSGFWDGGSDEIKAWRKAHKCNDLCKKLKLKGAQIRNDGPLRYGFPSP